MKLDQMSDFSKDVAKMLNTVGDGIDLDFEHITDSRDRQKQVEVFAKILISTKAAFR